VTGTRFTDIGLGRNTPYIYSVRGAGVTTPEITVMIPEPTITAPSTTTASTTTSTMSTTSSSTPAQAGPTGLRVSASTSNSITLSWLGGSTSSYDVLRAGVRIATVTGPGFTDIGLFPNTPYIYSVRGDGVTTPEITAVIH
jgi:hypothetical protein